MPRNSINFSTPPICFIFFFSLSFSSSLFFFFFFFLLLSHFDQIDSLRFSGALSFRINKYKLAIINHFTPSYIYAPIHVIIDQCSFWIFIDPPWDDIMQFSIGNKRKFIGDEVEVYSSSLSFLPFLFPFYFCFGIQNAWRIRYFVINIARWEATADEENSRNQKRTHKRKRSLKKGPLACR